MKTAVKTTDSAVDILWETAIFFADNPRSVIETEHGPLAVYVSPNGDKDPFARCITQKAVNALKGVRGPVFSEEIRGIIDKLGGLQRILLPEYQGHNIEFWWELQKFHDNPDHWVKDGLSAKGLLTLQTLIRAYSD